MHEPKNQEKFIKDTIEEVHNNLTKFILDTNYSNVQSIHLRNQLEEFKLNILKQEEKVKEKKSIFNKNQNIDKHLLPYLDNFYNPNVCFPNSSLFIQKVKNKNILRGFQDINKINEKDNQKIFNSKKKNLKISTNNYNIDKYYKFNNDIKNSKYFHHKLYDKYNNTIITNKDISLGIYDMNVKKLIPKGADVSLTMSLWGNPLKISGKNVKSTYKKSSSKDEVASGELNKLTANKYNLEEFYKTQPILNKKSKSLSSNIFLNSKNDYSFYPNNTYNKGFKTYKENINDDKTDRDNLFITDDSSLLKLNTNDTSNFGNKTKYSTNYKLNSFYDIKDQKKFNYTSYNKKMNKDFSNNFNSKKLQKFDKNKRKSFYKYIRTIDMKDNLIIKYYYFELVIDDQFNLFKQRNQKNWVKINNILANFNILFEKLNMNKAFIDSNKILKLLEYYNGNTKKITNKDLLMCLTKSDLIEKGYDPENESIIYKKIKEAFIIRIQKMYRKRLANKRYKHLKYINDIIVKIQKNVKMYLVRKNIEFIKENNKILIQNEYNEIFKQFKNDYDEIQSGQRIEIHINSISYNGEYNNCLINKYSMKENLQLSRLIRLVDPKIEIIYITPYQIPEEILSYYYSILENIGITNLDKRVHFIIPEACEFLPLNYSLSKLLYFSYRTILEIKSLVFGKKCYIMPGIIGDIEEKLSVALNIPMLMPPKNQIDLIFNKSEIKSALEINDIPFPISAWNIITEEEFYSSLAHLIATYPKIKIWIFKGNLDSNGTGIAYLNTDKIDIINQFRNEKKNNKDFTVEIFQEKLIFHLKNILIKNVVFVYPKLYKNWKAYLNHFLLNKGIIECCPTKDLDGIMGRPCIPMLIEPNGKVKILPTFEKINVDNFKNILCTSPQKCIDSSEMAQLADKIGNFLFNRGIVGYITVDCIIFHNGKKVLYWCVDMKYGFTQTICDIQFCYFLFIQSVIHKNKDNYEAYINEFIDNSEEMNKNNFNIEYNIDNDNDENDNKKEIIQDDENEVIPITNFQKKKINNNNFNESKNIDQLLYDSMVFSLPYIDNNFIKEIKLKDLLREFRYNNIVYNIIKRDGIIINLCDGLECGIFGLCGIINLEDIEMISPELKLWRLIETSINITKNLIYKIKKVKVMTPSIVIFHNEDERNDRIELISIIDKIKKVVKEKEIEQEKEEKRRKKIANSPFI